MRTAANPAKNVSFLFAAAVLLAVAPSVQAVIDLGATTRSTPYDRYMTPVKRVINNLDRSSEASFQEVSALMRQARGFRYSFSRDYVAATPEETARRRAGDCKDKSLWLVKAMGDSSVRFVIGKLTAGSRINHAWVYWQHNGEWFVLDPTHHARPLRAASLRANQYVPFYSYSRTAVYQHNTVMPVYAAVASGNTREQIRKEVAKEAPTRLAASAPAKAAAPQKTAAVAAPKAKEPIAEASAKVVASGSDNRQKDFAARLRALEGRS